jgi:hypothetical protein
VIWAGTRCSLYTEHLAGDYRATPAKLIRSTGNRLITLIAIGDGGLDRHRDREVADAAANVAALADWLGRCLFPANLISVQVLTN